MSRHHVEVTDEHMARAYRETAHPDWPSLEVLRDCYLHYSCVRGRAVAIANGTSRPPAPPAAAPPSTAPPATTRRRTDPNAPHDGDLFSPRMAAAGEYAHPDE